MYSLYNPMFYQTGDRYKQEVFSLLLFNVLYEMPLLYKLASDFVDAITLLVFCY